MNTDVGVARWQELIDAFLGQRERLVRIHPDLYEMSQPNPGATEEQLLAAEARLGHEIPAQYREFLSVANGWSQWNQDTALLSCDEIGHGTISESEGLGIRLAEGDVLVNWSTDVDWVRIADSAGTYWETFMLHRDSQGYRAGQLIVTPRGDRFHDSFEDYLVDRLTAMAEWLDGEELGPHGTSWGRDLRLDPPTMRQIVERLAALRTESAQLRDVAPPAPPNRAAAPSDIDALEQRLGRPLHPEHREFLEVADGWPDRVRDVLGVAEIADRVRWDATVARVEAQEAEIRRRVHGDSGPPVRGAPSGTPAPRISVVPFAVGMFPLGVDTDDGYVRNVPRDAKYLGDLQGGYHVSSGTVREALLDEIDDLCRQIDSSRRTGA